MQGTLRAVIYLLIPIESRIKKFARAEKKRACFSIWFNLKQPNIKKAKLDHGLQFFLSENKCFPYDIISKQEEIIVLKVRRQLKDKINESFYSIICNEATDISKTQQFSFLFASNNYDIREDFVRILPGNNKVF